MAIVYGYLEGTVDKIGEGTGVDNPVIVQVRNSLDDPTGSVSNKKVIIPDTTVRRTGGTVIQTIEAGGDEIIGDSLVEIFDQNMVSYGTFSIKADQDQNLNIVVFGGGGDPVTCTVYDSTGVTVLNTQVVAAGGAYSFSVADATTNAKNTQGTIIATHDLKAEEAKDLNIPDTDVQLRDSQGINRMLISKPSAEPNLVENLPDTAYSVRKFDNTLIFADNVRFMEVGKEYHVPNSILTANGDQLAIIQATESYTFFVYDAADGSTQLATAIVGGNIHVTIPVGAQPVDCTVFDSTGVTVLDNQLIASGGAYTYSAPDGTTNAKNTAGTTIATHDVKSNDTKDLAIPDTQLQLRDSASVNQLLIPTIISAAAGNTYDIPDVNFIVKKLDGTTIQSVLVKFLTNGEYLVPNNVLTVNSGAYIAIQATETHNIEVVDNADGTTVIPVIVDGNKFRIDLPSPIACEDISYRRPIGSQTATYYQYDEGWHFQNGTYAYSVVGKQPILLNYWELHPSTPNIHGRFRRFEGSTGGYYNQVTNTWHDVNDNIVAESVAFPLDYMIDHLTGLGWDRKRGGSTTLVSALPSVNDAGFSACGFTGDWRIPSDAELDSIKNNIFNHGYTAIFRQRPVQFDLTSIMTCSITPSDSTKALYYLNNTGDTRSNAVVATTSTVATHVRNHFN